MNSHSGVDFAKRGGDYTILKDKWGEYYYRDESGNRSKPRRIMKVLDSGEFWNRMMHVSLGVMEMKRVTCQGYCCSAIIRAVSVDDICNPDNFIRTCDIIDGHDIVNEHGWCRIFDILEFAGDMDEHGWLVCPECAEKYLDKFIYEVELI